MWNNTGKCPKCKIGFQVYAFIMLNGSKTVVDKCPRCGRDGDLNQPYLPSKDYDWEMLPLWEDRSKDSPKCSYLNCNNKEGVELHHFAPKATFGEDADNWPVAYLCKIHHNLWHKKINK